MTKKLLLTKVLTVLLLLGSGVGNAWASTDDDLSTIDANFSFTPTEALTDATLYSDGKILSLGGNGYNNGVQIKTNRQLAFKVAAGATVVVSFKTNSSRAMQIGTTSAGTDLGTSTNGTLTATVSSESTLYLSASADLYMTKLEVKYMQIGSSDNTAGWWTAFSQYYTIQAGKQLEFSFTNHSSKEKAWYNWVLVATNGERGSTGYAEYMVLRADNYAWGTLVVNTDPKALPNITFKDGASWDTFDEDMDGASVDVKVSFSGTQFFVYAVMTNNGRKYILTETTNALSESVSSAKIFFTVEKSNISDFNLNSEKNAYKVYIVPTSNGTVSVENADGIALGSLTYVGNGESFTATAIPDAGYRFVQWGSGSDNPRSFTVNGGEFIIYSTFEKVGFDVSELEVQLLDVSMTTGMPTISGATYSSSNIKIARVDASTGALTFLKSGYCSINATVGGNTYSYTLKVLANDATTEVTSEIVGSNTKYTYRITGAGKIGSNYVTEIPGITLQYGNGSETVIARPNVSESTTIGASVIGAKDGYLGSLQPDAIPGTTGTYYIFTPTINGTLNISGFSPSTCSHSAWLKEYDPTTNTIVGSTNVATISRASTPTDLVSSDDFSVQAGKSYILYAVLEDGHTNYFCLNSFSFTPTLKFDSKSQILTKQSSYSLVPQTISGIGSSQTCSYKVTVAKDGGSNLTASYDAGTNKINISSPTDADGGAVIVSAIVDGVELSLSYVLTVPYIGNHVWDFHNIENKSDNPMKSHYYLTYEVRNSSEVKDPIVVLQDKIEGDNAAYIDQTNGVAITTNTANRLGFSVVGSTIDNTSNATRLAADISNVTDVNLIAIRNASVTIPQLKKDWFVKVYLDPHSGNSGAYGSGCQFKVSNLKDLTGKAINAEHWIRSYGTQWSQSNGYDDKTRTGSYAGCVIFRVDQPGDVMFTFSDTGWDKIVKIEVSDTYSTEMVLGSNASRTVDYLRWNHSWVHRENADGTDTGVSFYYNGDAASKAENAKYIDHQIICLDGTVQCTLTDNNWTSKRGAQYCQADMTATSGVGNVKLLSNATYQAYNNDGDEVTGSKYVLNRNETWLVVGKLKVQNYPYTWDFASYNMDKPAEANRTVTKQLSSTRSKSGVEVSSDTTYGAWTSNHATNILAEVYASAAKSTNAADETSPFYHINADGTKIYNYTIHKPLFANGAQLTTGFDAIPETEGLGVSISNAYFYTGHYSDPRQRQIVLDGTQLKVNDTNFAITIPEVPAGMYVFINGATPSSYTNLEASDKEFASKSGVVYYKVTSAGDVVLNFASGSSIYKIGVTDQVKTIAYFGYSTDSRNINIDYNETRSFSANMSAFYVTDVQGWKDQYQVKTSAQSVNMADGQYVPAGTGIVLKNNDCTWTKANAGSGSNALVPLFVPAVNIPVTTVPSGNLLLPTTNSEHDTATIGSTLVSDEDSQYPKYYVMSNYYYEVQDADNAHVSDKIYTDTPGFYRYIGAGQTAANLAYLKFDKTAANNAKYLGDFIFIDFDEETTAIEALPEVAESNRATADVYYNLNGQIINGKPSTRGIYIKNGKKVFVK